MSIDNDKGTGQFSGVTGTVAETIGTPSVKVVERWKRDREKVRQEVQGDGESEVDLQEISPPPYWLVFPAMIVVAIVFFLVARYVFDAV